MWLLQPWDGNKRANSLRETGSKAAGCHNQLDCTSALSPGKRVGLVDKPDFTVFLGIAGCSAVCSRVVKVRLSEDRMNLRRMRRQYLE